MKRLREVTDELYQQLKGDEKALVDAMIGINKQYGKFGSEGSNVYISYKGPEENEDKEIGVKCGNCVFHYQVESGIACSAIEAEIEDGGICRLSMIPPGLVDVSEAAAGALKTGDFVSWNSSGGRSQGKISRIVKSGKINVPDSSFEIEGTEDNPAALIVVWQKSDDGWAASDRKVGHKFSTLTKIASLGESIKTVEAETYSPPEGVRAAARRALKWISDGKAGSGFTSVGRRRAAQLAAGTAVSRDTIARMRSFFARHESASKGAKGFNAGETGYPSPGRVAWDAWGGNAGKSWANGINIDEAATAEAMKKRKKRRRRAY